MKEQNNEKFNATKKIGIYLYVDEVKRQWAIPTMFGGVKENATFSFDDIVDFELLEDGTSVATQKSLGKAVAGGLLLGGVGALVGGMTGEKATKELCTKLQVKITLNNMTKPVLFIDLILTKTKKDSFVYKTAYKNVQEILGVLQLICSQNTSTTTENGNTNNSVVDEIKKFKELLDIGAITEEEFAEKKKQLLQ